MRSATAAALIAAIALCGCAANSLGIPDWPLGPPAADAPAPRGSIKDVLPSPAPKKPAAKIAVSSISVEGVPSEAAAGLTNAIRAELVTAGYVLDQPGYKLFANVATAETGIRITWSVLDHWRTELGVWLRYPQLALLPVNLNVDPSIPLARAWTWRERVGAGALVLSLAHLPEWRESLIVAQHQHRSLVEAIAGRQGTWAEQIAKEHARLSRQNLDLVLARREILDVLPGAPLLNVAALED